ncbi:MAG TPA: polyphosphate kinase 1 [Longimicrobiaceae bacterium]|nr:polyphosphate kinase 1 [Longimicrobiaceae bacterium]
MKSSRILRFKVPSQEALDQLVSAQLPLGLEGGPVRRTFFRSIYFDTSTGDLERRGATVCLTIRDDGTRTFAVDVTEREGEGEPEKEILPTHSEVTVTDTDIRELLASDSEPTELLRAMVDPARLAPQLELETTRRLRDATSADKDASLELAYDTVTLRKDELSAEFFSLELWLPPDQNPALDGLVQAFEQQAGLQVTLADPLGRAREVLERAEFELLEHAVRSARAVAVLAYRDGAIALHRVNGSLEIPTAPGAGEEACRQVMRACFGRAQGQVRLLRRSPGVGMRPAIEVWLAERTHVAAGDGVADELEWIPIEDALQLVGTEQIRDAATLVALNAAARSSLPIERRAAALARGKPRTRKLMQYEKRGGTAAAPRAAGIERNPHKKGAIPPELLLNMELSELGFNGRLLRLAQQPDVPLLERVRFVSILGSNLDEFFTTRVAGFKQQVGSASTKKTMDGLTAEQQLDVIGIRVRELMDEAYDFLETTLLPQLEEENIRVRRWADLEPDARRYLSENYAAHLDAVLTPLAADPSHPFPHIRNLRPALAVIVRVPESEVEHFAAIELPGDLPRFVPLPGGRDFVPLEDVIVASLPELYAGHEVARAHPFRVARSANFSLDDDTVSDMLQAVQEEVAKRPLGPVVRLEVEESMPPEVRELLLRELQFEAREEISTLSEEDIYVVPWLVDLASLREIASLPGPDLHYAPLQHTSPLDPSTPVVDILQEREVLVQFPFDSFEQTVERFLAEAAVDPEVLAIKITLYRTDSSSRVVKLLRRARQKGKQVVALVELKASFDETRNIEWARSLEEAGIHVIYGPPRLKVHAKIALVVRREGEDIRRYVYVGTGNLNAATAAGYTDLGLLTNDAELGEEVNDVFNSLTGYSGDNEYERLLVAPFNMRDRFIGMVARETEHARAGRGGKIRVKINGLTDRELISALYEASQAGVDVQMMVRGICALRPGIAGYSENIRIVSVLGQFLEHMRIYHFENAGDPEYFIGSADWRPRNLSKRIEVAAPVRTPEHRSRLDDLLNDGLNAPRGWELQSDGSYRQGRVEP